MLMEQSPADLQGSVLSKRRPKSGWLKARLRVIAVLEAIRSHRDQLGDDRCWFDDRTLYKCLPRLRSRRALRLTVSQMARLCEQFYDHRAGGEAPQKTAEPGKDYNAYLDSMTLSQLRKELKRLYKAVRTHRNVGDGKRTRADDEQLYAALPDGIEADFWMPERSALLANCARICTAAAKRNPYCINLSCWPPGLENPLANLRRPQCLNV